MFREIFFFMNHYIYSPINTFYRAEDIWRLEDDGCPNFWPELEETPTKHVTTWQYGEKYPWEEKMWRVFSCSQCGWYVWHAIGTCHKCGGRMRMLKGHTSELQAHLKKNNFEDGGF